MKDRDEARHPQDPDGADRDPADRNPRDQHGGNQHGGDQDGRNQDGRNQDGADGAGPGGTADPDSWVDVDDGTETTVLPVVGHDSGKQAYTRVPEVPTTSRAGEDTEPGRGSRGGALTNPLRVVLAAAVVGALIAGAVAIWQGIGDGGDVANTGIGGKEKLAKNAFTESVAGDCLDWPAGNPGDPKKVDCDLRHRFEVAGPLDTALLPGSEFGESATWPGAERFAQIRDEQCAVIADRYLGGKRDPHGRFSVSMMFPSQVQWDKGARELRCGLQQTGPDGQPAQFAGRVAGQDQSFKWAAGTCVGIDAARKPTAEVNCTENHSFQTTGTVDLAAKFGDRLSGRPWPSKDEQNAFLASVCPSQADRFMGGKAKLDATTLNTQWSVVLEPSWLAGSRTAVCYLGLPDRGGFATLVGDARETLLINGKLPVPPPQAPPGRALPTPVPLPGGYDANPQEVPAPGG